MRWIWHVALGLGAVAGTIYLTNASWLAEAHGAGVKLIAHRGIYQTYDHMNLGRDTCTANRIAPPKHEFIENTIPSIREALRLGANMVEIDVHPTADNEFVVFHDWTLECRTNGQGVTREQTLDYLQSLDVGYGYTADNGRSYPLRGKGERMMPSLEEVLKTFPNERFLINIKSKDTGEAEALSFYLQRHDIQNTKRLWVYGWGKPIERMASLRPEMRAFDMSQMKACAKDYMFHGWYGAVPQECEGQVMFVGLNYTAAVWGWPRKFQSRMRGGDIEPVLLGADLKDADGRGLNSLDEWARVPEDYTGWVWTDRIEIIGPAARKR